LPTAVNESPPLRAVFRTLPGRLFILSSGLLVILLLIQQIAALPEIVDLFRKVVTLAWLASGALNAWNLLAGNRRRLLWRVRRKLILSYVFLGIVPVVLIVAFGLAGAVVLYTNVAAYVFQEGFDDVVEDVRQIAETSAFEIGRNPSSAADALARKYVNLQKQYPELSMAVVRAQAVPAPGGSRVAAAPTPVAAAGAWRHQPAPLSVPAWVATQGFAGVLPLKAGAESETQQLFIRAAIPTENRREIVIADLPVDDGFITRLQERTGTRMGAMTVPPECGGTAAPVDTTPAGRFGTLFQRTVVFLDCTSWETGARTRAASPEVPLNIAISLAAPIGELYTRLTAVQSQQIARGLGPGGSGLLIILVVLALLFLVIQGSAIVMGAVLARSITSAVHELFEGTERVRQGDFTHRIDIRSRDQLGDLADSFNRMSASMEHLLHVQREKQRLDDELRIAREIQKSLLPVQTPRLDGLSVADLCEPAREVGGDYYDFFQLGPRQIGVLIADVSGKGTSAALYMAELKGLMLALSHTERSPRRLLIDVNHMLAEHLDNRSFITMTYAVLDLEARTLTCARAGHTPLIVVSNGQSKVVTPDGMVLGLRLPGAGERFEQILREHTQLISPGDVIVLYTDGITEAMDRDGELFGDTALAELVARNHELDAAGLRERVVREVKAFVGDAEPHDDMTMVVMKVT
jgi:sigma-B regulation protein RsbU (phosphoserine phosphatase)